MKKISYKIINKKKELTQLRNKIKLISLETKPFNKKLYLEKFWDWQYKKLPSKISYIFGAYDRDKIIGYIHVPIFNYFLNDKVILSACIQEVAIDKDYRKLKIFSHFLEYSIKYLKKKKIQFIYSFPNKRSIKAFLNLKFKKVLKYKLSLVPIFFLKKSNQKIFISTKFRKEFNHCNTIFLKKHSSGILKNEKYFKWRFESSLKTNYIYIYTKTKKKVTAFIVVRRLKFFGLNFIIIMDLGYQKKNYLIELVRSLRMHKLFKSVSFLILSGNFKGFCYIIKKINGISIPDFINVRKLFYVISTNNNFQKKNLSCNFSDWDVL